MRVAWMAGMGDWVKVTVIHAAAVIALAAGCAAAQGGRASAVPFPIHHGVNVSGAFVRAQSPPRPGADGQVSAFFGLGRNPPSYSAAELKRMGFDFVRYPVNPAVLLENPPAVRARLIQQTEDGFQPYIAQDMRVVYDLQFWAPPNPIWTSAAVITDAAKFAQYRALVTEVAARLARRPAGQVAIELMNEPAHSVCAANKWFQQQNDLIRAVRRVSPRLTIIATGCDSAIDDLMAMNAGNTDLSDPNIVYTFHFYEPFVFTHQGAYGGHPYVVDFHYPSTQGSAQDTLAQMYAAIDAQHLSIADSVQAKLWAASQVSHYYAAGANKAKIEKRLDAILAWASTNHIPASRLYLGEFAAINWFRTDSPQRLSERLAWDNDVKAAADARGIAASFWNLPPTRGPIFR